MVVHRSILFEKNLILHTYNDFNFEEFEHCLYAVPSDETSAE